MMILFMFLNIDWLRVNYNYQGFVKSIVEIDDDKRKRCGCIGSSKNSKLKIRRQ